MSKDEVFQQAGLWHVRFADGRIVRLCYKNKGAATMWLRKHEETVQAAQQADEKP